MMHRYDSVFPDPMRAAEQTILNQEPYNLSTGIELRTYCAIKIMSALVSSFPHLRGKETITETGIGIYLAKEAVALTDHLIDELNSNIQ